ncbi:siderophore synthetase component [Neorhizobium huautlense]|uniref:Siderophore synthetase component n=1 Tax=Neorhizobium huautlense TaxID=67774 RepID=A0ABT9PQ26_9HYPH|nr:IucA/IucC family protein [Neorhizobium huautlense]MDP9836557.1 siderophore synthetase component [Neorhizobium huautlense]
MPLPLEIPAEPQDRVSRQLVAAILFEGLVSFRREPPDRLIWTLDGREYRCRAALSAFGRPRIVPHAIEMKGDHGVWVSASLPAIVMGLPGNGITRGKLLRELEHTVALCQWNEDSVPARDRRTMGFADLDGALHEGHPYHPCFKARYGFTLDDNRLYGPESAKPFRLVWILHARQNVRQVLGTDEQTFWRQELGAEIWNEIDAARQARGLSWQNFALVPMHPWQWRRLKDGAGRELIATGRLHGLGQFGDRYLASQSLRTLHNLDRPQAASIKLPLDVVNTSSRRILDPHSVCTAPVLSTWIAGMVDGDPAFSDRYPLGILEEYAGILAEHGGELAGQIGAIWRQSAVDGLEPGEAVIPFNALMMLEADHKPYLQPWIEQYGLMPWLNRLLEVTILPVWHLLVRHGLAVEAHGQNMLLVHRDGWPVRLILRDFHESVEFCPAFLRNPDAAPDFLSLDARYREAAPDQYYWTDNLDSLRELVADTLFVYNLAEIAHLLEHVYQLPEKSFWQRVEAILSAYATEHDAADRMAALGYDRPDVLTESLLTRKLLAREPEYHHTVPNVFAKATAERRIMP